MACILIISKIKLWCASHVLFLKLFCWQPIHTIHLNSIKLTFKLNLDNWWSVNCYLLLTSLFSFTWAFSKENHTFKVLIC